MITQPHELEHIEVREQCARVELSEGEEIEVPTQAMAEAQRARGAAAKSETVAPRTAPMRSATPATVSETQSSCIRETVSKNRTWSPRSRPDATPAERRSWP